MLYFAATIIRFSRFRTHFAQKLFPTSSASYSLIPQSVDSAPLTFRDGDKLSGCRLLVLPAGVLNQNSHHGDGRQETGSICLFGLISHSITSGFIVLLLRLQVAWRVKTMVALVIELEQCAKVDLRAEFAFQGRLPTTVVPKWSGSWGIFERAGARCHKYFFSI